MKPTIVTGNITCDAELSSSMRIELFPEGIQLWHAPTGKAHFLKTCQPASPGMKVVAAPNQPALDPDFLGRILIGGGLHRVGTQLHKSGHGSLKLLNSGTSTRDLDRFVHSQGMNYRSIRRHKTPTNLIVFSLVLTSAFRHCWRTWRNGACSTRR